MGQRHRPLPARDRADRGRARDAPPRRATRPDRAGSSCRATSDCWRARSTRSPSGCSCWARSSPRPGRTAATAKARRLGWPLGDVARVHGVSVDVLVVLTLVLVVALVRVARAAPRAQRRVAHGARDGRAGSARLRAVLRADPGACSSGSTCSARCASSSACSSCCSSCGVADDRSPSTAARPSPRRERYERRRPVASWRAARVSREFMSRAYSRVRVGAHAGAPLRARGSSSARVSGDEPVPQLLAHVVAEGGRA